MIRAVNMRLEDEKRALERAEEALRGLQNRTEVASANFAIINDVLIKVQGLLYVCLDNIKSYEDYNKK